MEKILVKQNKAAGISFNRASSEVTFTGDRKLKSTSAAAAAADPS